MIEKQFSSMATDGELLRLAKSYKDGMQRLGGGVCVITAEHNGRRSGLTATAVCSFSADPPMLLACVNAAGSAHATICASRTLCVNVLSKEHINIARRFAGATGEQGDARFAAGQWRTVVTGAPVLDDALAAFECNVINSVQCKTHSAFVCLVTAVHNRSLDGSPLIYAGRQYALVQPI